MNPFYYFFVLITAITQYIAFGFNFLSKFFVGQDLRCKDTGDHLTKAPAYGFN